MIFAFRLYHDLYPKVFGIKFEIIYLTLLLFLVKMVFPEIVLGVFGNYTRQENE